MKKTLLTFLVAATLVLPGGAWAQGHHRNHGYHHYRPQHHGHHGHHYRPNYAPWIAGAVGLGIMGAIIANQHPTCQDRVVGQDHYGNMIVQRYCY
jgi:hypothetical protein